MKVTIEELTDELDQCRQELQEKEEEIWKLQETLQQTEELYDSLRSDTGDFFKQVIYSHDIDCH